MTALDPKDHVVLMDAQRIWRSIRRIAFSLAEEYPERSLMLVGLNSRGFAIASRLRDILDTIVATKCELIRLDIEAGIGEHPSAAFDDKTVIVVDDVIFSGSTMQRAVMSILQHAMPQALRCVALVDRGHRKLPVEPQFCGLVCPTKLREHVHVDLQPESERDQVLLVKNGQP